MANPDVGAQNRRRPGFQPGQSGNPAGRPKGSAGKAAALRELLSADDVREVVAALLTEAKSGSVPAARLLLERLFPPARERLLDLADMPVGDGVDAVTAAQGWILGAVAAGRLTTGEAAALAGIWEARRKAFESQELELRLSEIEQGVAKKKAGAD